MKYLVSVVAALCLVSYLLPSAASAESSSVKLVPVHQGCDSLAAVDGAAFFVMPAIAEQQGASGIAQVKIDLSSGGVLTGEQLFSSSGNPWLDDAALFSARMSRYTAETVNCQRVGGSYLYEVDF